MGLGFGGDGWPGTHTAIFRYTAGKAVDKSNFWNEISKENYKTNALWKNQVNVDTDYYLNLMLKTT